MQVVMGHVPSGRFRQAGLDPAIDPLSRRFLKIAGQVKSRADWHGYQ
jgi:hypothetical protein